MQHIRPLVLASIALLALSACGHNTPTATAETATPETTKASAPEQQTVGPALSLAGFTDTIALEVKPTKQQKKASTKSSAQAKPSTPSTATAKATPKSKGKTERIYVETEGAQGRVWGHVTLQGDRGTGTIHDWDENTLAVTVTRHGNELYAVDQNSRQYVFRLR